MSNKISQKINGDNNVQIAIENFSANVTQISSILAEALPKVSDLLSKQGDDSQNDTLPYEIEDKIEHNHVQTFRSIIDEYGEYGIQIDTIYDEYDDNVPGFKKKVFRYFSTKYALKKEQLLSKNNGEDQLEVIRSNSDSILRETFNEFRDDLKNSDNLNISIEEIDACALAVVCHAFISCKILEKPKK